MFIVLYEYILTYALNVHSICFSCKPSEEVSAQHARKNLFALCIIPSSWLHNIRIDFGLVFGIWVFSLGNLLHAAVA